MRSSLIVRTALCLSVALVACKKDDGGKKNNNNNNTVNGAAALTAVCNYFERCATTIGRAFPNANVCSAFFSEDCVPIVFHNTQAQVDACIAFVTSAACVGNLLDDPSFENGPCGLLDTNPNNTRVGVGASCYDNDCVQTAFCDDYNVPNNTCPLCVARKGASSDCQDDRDCQDGLFCDPGSTSCMAKKSNTTACDGDSECTSGVCEGTCQNPLERNANCSSGGRCRGFLECINGTCQDKGAASATCSDSGDCINGLSCVASVCTAVTVCGNVAANGPCVQNDDCASGLFCDDSQGTCEALVAINGDCSNADCVDGAYCDFNDTTCKALLTENADCTSGTCTENLFCDVFDTVTCLPRKANSSPCTYYFECASFNCDAGLCVEESTCVMP